MKFNRRNFLKQSGIAGMGLAGASTLSAYSSLNVSNPNDFQGKALKQTFNMSGYAAPKMENVRAGFIGLGHRGPVHMSNFTRIEGAKVMALCDLNPDHVNAANKSIESSGHKPEIYTGSEDAWKKVCERNDIDVIFIATPWSLHTPMALYAMDHGKHVFIEVSATTTLDQCWQLVETSERNRTHCMILENCCYDFFELLTLNMARQGFFGDIVHCEGAYIHTLLGYNPGRKVISWRQKENIERNGNLYPTHGLGPICQIMDINRGDKMEYLVSASSKDFMMGKNYQKAAEENEYWKPWAEKALKAHRGNMNTSIITTNQGRTIMVQHDITSPNVYSRIHKVSGTKAAALKYPLPAKISVGHEWLTDDEYKTVEDKYKPEIVKKIGEMAKQVGGHGGMDFLMDWRIVDCLRNGLPLDIDVYDTAVWSSIFPLSEWSVTNRSSAIDVPDFTRGSWKNNKPHDIELKTSGNTKVLTV